MTDLDAIRARDAAADDCAVCEFSADMPHHGPVEDGCPVPKEHHDYVKGTPSFTGDRDRRALLAEVDRLRALVEEDFGPGAADEPGMCECGHDMDAHAGGMVLLHHDMFQTACIAERIRAAVEGLPPFEAVGGWHISGEMNEPIADAVDRAAVLAAIEGAEHD